MFRPYSLSALVLVLGLFAPAIPAIAAPLGEDGLHKTPWFAMTFRDVAEDIEAARAEGKRLAMVFEQRGCIYCAAMHEKLLADPEVADYIKENFVVVQYNMFGDEEVTDLDGDVLTEKTAARKWGYVFTPTIVFLPETPPGEGTVAEAAVATMPGAFGKWTFLNMFRWVRDKGYESDEHFQKYHARIINELRAEGRLDAE
ncbi:SoxW family protein [Pseudohoeflea coraliihabitans]|uniref:Thioredoxin family protein n=1 Tax=Pseudohoeflea coraliihabitans TaxID=2860393 RepID=A0ABS6WQZ9_9HYPH|nr:thioredoxin family protein [Pseudohoeflea sp. DP4N28-3]MBW3098393.1 thioredoxin family protein [Pseudohoeflea sp. DP4N28-3]